MGSKFKILFFLNRQLHFSCTTKQICRASKKTNYTLSYEHSGVFLWIKCVFTIYLRQKFRCNFTVEVFCTLTLISVCEAIKIKGIFFLYFWRYLALGILSYNSFAYNSAVERKCKHLSVPVLCSPFTTTSYITRKKKGCLIVFFPSRLTYVFLFRSFSSCVPHNNDTGE